MKIDLTETNTVDAKFLQVNAHVRYWDDAIINGESSEDGDSVPFKVGDMWRPLLDIDNGLIVDWPAGVEASFHFKVCDAGTYDLLSAESEILKSIDGYVPEGLCHGDKGYGDYIIFDVGVDGKIKNYAANLNCDDWCDQD